MQQVPGLTQMTGEFMHLKPIVIDLGWGDIKSALLNLADKSFVKPAEVKTAVRP